MTDGAQGAAYVIRLDGHLDDRWAGWLDSVHRGVLQIRRESDGTTTISGIVADQAELHGLLAKVRDIGATLLSVDRIKMRP